MGELEIINMVGLLAGSVQAFLGGPVMSVMGTVLRVLAIWTALSFLAAGLWAWVATSRKRARRHRAGALRPRPVRPRPVGF